MGIGGHCIDYYHNLYDKGFFKKINNVIELGSQLVYIKNNEEDFFNFLIKIGISKPFDIITGIVGDEINHLNYTIPAKYIYNFLGIDDYSSIDVDELFGAFGFDLNKDIKTCYSFNKQYDLVTNHGTTEHCFNQLSCFKNIHDLTKKNGYMIHSLPHHSNEHGLFDYTRHFFDCLINYNKYKAMYFKIYDASKYSSIFITLKKRNDKDFIVPVDNVSINHIKKNTFKR